MGIGSGELPSDSTCSGGVAGWLPALALAGAAFASGVLVAQLSARYSASKARRSAVGIIPARYMSSRFEGKPLALILGKPMIQRTWEQVKLASALDDVVVATDDKRIADCCRNFGAQVVMTSVACRNGTERCEEAMRSLKKKYDIVVNVQGDEPLIDPEIIDGVVQALRNSPDAKFSTAVTALSPENAHDPNRVKCVVDQLGYAIYFSRGLIPFSKYDRRLNKKAIANPDFPYYLHLGVQCYDAKFLSVFPKIAPTPLQLEEDLEQLKVLENGYKMKIIKVDHTGHGVDVPSDIQKVESYMRAEHLN